MTPTDASTPRSLRRPRLTGARLAISVPGPHRRPRIMQVTANPGGTARRPGMSVDFFNTDETAPDAAGGLSLRHRARQPHILVAHLDALGSGWYTTPHALVRQRRDKRPTRSLSPSSTTIRRTERAAGQHPALEKVCEFFHLSPPLATSPLPRPPRSGTPPLSRAYVTAYDDDQVFETALAAPRTRSGDPRRGRAIAHRWAGRAVR